MKRSRIFPQLPSGGISLVLGMSAYGQKLTSWRSTAMSASCHEQTSGRIRYPDVRLLVCAGLAIEVNSDWRKRAFKRISARSLEALLRPVLPERDGLPHDHRTLARPDQLAAGREMTSEPRVVGLPAFVGPRHVVRDRDPRMPRFGRRAYGHHDSIQSFALCEFEKGADHHPRIALGAMHGRD